jgi:hypothetical protein
MKPDAKARREFGRNPLVAHGWAHEYVLRGFDGGKSDMTVFKRRPKGEGFLKVEIRVI